MLNSTLVQRQLLILKLEYVSVSVARSAVLLYDPSTYKTIWIMKFVNWTIAKISGGPSFLVFDFSYRQSVHNKFSDTVFTGSKNLIQNVLQKLFEVFDKHIVKT